MQSVAHTLRVVLPGLAGMMMAVLPAGAMGLTSETVAEAASGGVRATGGTVIVTGSQEAEASVETHIDSAGTAEVRIETRRDGVTRATTTRTAVPVDGSLDVSARSSAEGTSMQVRTRGESGGVRNERTIINERSSTTVSAVATSTPSHELPTAKRPVVQRIADLLRRILFFWR